MDEQLEDYIKEALKGIWSPFLRIRIRRELIDHVKDIQAECSMTIEESIEFLGDPKVTNRLYKNLMYKKLTHDMFLYGGSLCSIFILGVFYIHNAVDEYQRVQTENFLNYEKNYKTEVKSLNYFKRHNESRNAAAFFSQVVDSNGKIAKEDFLSEIHKYDYWDPSEFASDQSDYYKRSSELSKMMARLAKFSQKRLRESGQNIQQLEAHKKLAQLIYSTETMIGYRIANSMMEGSLINEKGRLNLHHGTKVGRVSGMTWGMLNLRPSVVAFEKTFRDSNYYDVGICHHSEEFWYQDAFFKNVTEATFPGEKNWNEVLESVSRIKRKMKKECRLSFLKHIKAPDPMTWESIYVTGPEDQVLRRLYEQLIVSVSTVPYLRNAAGRYVVERATISVQGNGKEFYSNYF